jgi:hypothetical protein
MELHDLIKGIALGRPYGVHANERKSPCELRETLGFRDQFIDNDPGLLTERDARPIIGASLVYHMDLQSGSYVSFLHVREGGVWEEFGYKQRSSALFAISGGRRVRVSPAVALGLGLVQPDKKKGAPPPPAPDVPGAFAEALKLALQEGNQNG